MADLVKDAQRKRPGPAGGVGVARAVMDVAEVIERVSLVVAVGEFLADIKGPLIAADGLLVVAELVADVAEAVPGGGLPAAFG